MGVLVKYPYLVFDLLHLLKMFAKILHKALKLLNAFNELKPSHLLLLILLVNQLFYIYIRTNINHLT